MLKTFYIYTLRNPAKNEIFYVGLTDNPDRRIKQHRGVSRKDTTKRKVYIDNMGCLPELSVVDQIEIMIDSTNCCDLHPIESQRLEYRWIIKMRKEGHPLTNNPKTFGPTSKVFFPESITA